MVTEIKTITDVRNIERAATANLDARQAIALEHIADTLEAIRLDLISYIYATAKISSDPSQQT